MNKKRTEDKMGKTTIAACLLMGAAVAAQADESSVTGFEPALWGAGDTQATAATGRAAAEPQAPIRVSKDRVISRRITAWPLRTIALQLHAGRQKAGAIYQGQNVMRFINWLSELPVGSGLGVVHAWRDFDQMK